VKGVPHFWLRALGNCRETEGLIEEHDIPILEHLLDVKVRLLEGDGYVHARLLQYKMWKRSRILCVSVLFFNVKSDYSLLSR
jgi:hypothetical protein